jgi:hypothetical protein
MQRKADMVARIGRMLSDDMGIGTYGGLIMLYKELCVLVAGIWVLNHDETSDERR